jgi:enoyl-CoA hydratase
VGWLKVEVVDLVATVTFDRPPVNAVDFEAMAEITAAFESLANRKDVNCAIFTAAGTRAFIAGADLKAGPHPPTDGIPSKIMDPHRLIRDALKAIRECQVPVVGAINGPAIGAGLALAGACDILIAAETATFGLTEINVGLLGGAAHLQRMVGTYKMRKMFYTGELATAAEFHRLGAVEQVVPHAELLPAARKLAAEIASKSPIALRLAKDSANRIEHMPTDEAYRVEQTYTARLLDMNDSKEAVAAYLEKRKPTWTWS